MTAAYSRAYLLTKVMTANNREVILYLYEGAIQYVRRAIEDREKGNESVSGEAVDRVIAILIELSCCLDYNHTGALALRLDSIYNYLIQALTLSNKGREIEPLQTCESVISTLSDAWRQAIQTERGIEVEGAAPQLQVSC